MKWPIKNDAARLAHPVDCRCCIHFVGQLRPDDVSGRNAGLASTSSSLHRHRHAQQHHNTYACQIFARIAVRIDDQTNTDVLDT